MEEIMPCPFCGGEGKLVGGEEIIIPEIDKNGAYVGAEYVSTPAYVECQNCRASGPDFNEDDNDRENAVAAWNRRNDNG